MKAQRCPASFYGIGNSFPFKIRCQIEITGYAFSTTRKSPIDDVTKLGTMVEGLGPVISASLVTPDGYTR